jgi:hypothetical protein
MVTGAEETVTVGAAVEAAVIVTVLPGGWEEGAVKVVGVPLVV